MVHTCWGYCVDMTSRLLRLRLWINHLHHLRARRCLIWRRPSVFWLTAIFFTNIRWWVRTSNFLLLVQFILEAIVNNEGWLIDIEMGSRSRWAILPNNCVIDESLITLILDQINVLLGECINIVAAVVDHSRWGDNSIWMFLCDCGFLTTWLAISATLMMYISWVTPMVISIYQCAIFLAGCNTRCLWASYTTFLVVHKFLVLIQKSFFEFIISLRILLILLWLSMNSVTASARSSICLNHTL